MKTRNFPQILSTLLIIFALHTNAFAQVEKVTFHLDNFYCGYECVNTVNHVLKVYNEEIAYFKIDAKAQTVVIYPNANQPFDLYEIRKELRNAEQPPKKINLIVTGEITDYAKVYSGGVVHPRKVLRIKETGQRFVLNEGKQLENLLDSVKAGQPITVVGRIVGFSEKHLPVLMIEDFAESTENLAKVEKTGEKKIAARKTTRPKA